MELKRTTTKQRSRIRSLQESIIRRNALAMTFIAICGLQILIGSTTLFAQQSELDRKSSWQIPTFESVRNSVMQLTEEAKSDELTRAKIEALWADDTIASDQLVVMRQYLETLPLVFPETGGICDRILSEQIDQRQLDAAMLDNDLLPEQVRDNLRLGLARTLVISSLFDEALDHLMLLDTGNVVDPATLLYFRAVCQRNLLDREGCLKTVELLLENEGSIPRRYQQVGELIAADIDPLKADSLDEIARLMEDIKRRQDLNRSGKKVIGQEDEVIAKLDKMIEDLEKKAQQQQQMAQASATPSSSKPMDDSIPAGGRGAGDVDDRPQIDGGKWGDLPPRQREAAMAELVKDLPPHYRQVIEEYFKKLARDEPRQ